MKKPEILAAGARFDPITQTVQAVVVITDENNGHVDHLNPHKIDAENLGHQWVNIPVETFRAFKNPAELEAHIAANLE